MFNLGNGDKEKLEENMEEIKQLVNEGKNSGEEDQNTQEALEGLNGLEEDLDPAVDELENNSQPQTSENNGLNVQPDSSKEQEVNPAPEQVQEPETQDLEQAKLNNTPENTVQNSPQAREETAEKNDTDDEFEEMQEELQNEINSIKEQQEHHDQQRQYSEKEPENDQSQQRGYSETKHSVKDDKEVVEDANSINEKSEHQIEERADDAYKDDSEEPLFLEVENFEDIKHMVEEMHYLTTEMDDVMGHMEAGIEEDEETMTEAEQIVDEFEARRDKIQKTLN